MPDVEPRSRNGAVRRSMIDARGRRLPHLDRSRPRSVGKRSFRLPGARASSSPFVVPRKESSGSRAANRTRARRERDAARRAIVRDPGKVLLELRRPVRTAATSIAFEQGGETVGAPATRPRRPVSACLERQRLDDSGDPRRREVDLLLGLEAADAESERRRGEVPRNVERLEHVGRLRVASGARRP